KRIGSSFTLTPKATNLVVPTLRPSGPKSKNISASGAISETPTIGRQARRWSQTCWLPNLKRLTGPPAPRHAQQSPQTCTKFPSKGCTMPARSPFDPSNLRKLPAGTWTWQDGVGFRTDTRGGGTWYVKYWAPVPVIFPEGARPPLRQVKERLPNCRNRSQAEGVLMARRSAIFEGTYRPRRKVQVTTLADFAPRFLEAKRHLRTVVKYRLLIHKYLL